MQTIKILVVDLDGTIIRSDMLYESFWNAFGRDFRIPLHVLSQIPKGKVAIKSYLAQASTLEPEFLPYNEEVLQYIRDHRKKGGKVVLATATHKSLANKISKHLGLFDEVYGSSSKCNLKGETKADFLENKFGEGNFCYLGDSRSDLAVWRVAGKIITFNASASTKQQADKFCKPIEHLASHKHPLEGFIRVLRPHQWMKNSLVFVPIAAAHQFSSSNLINTIIAFIVFCLVASGSYVINDLLDLSSDRAHPRKKLRPLASGNLNPAYGTVLGVAMILLGLTIATILDFQFFLISCFYLCLTISYSLAFKEKIILDVCILAILYSMRIVAGGIATDTDLSLWLISFSMFFFMSLAAVKRQAELVDMDARGILQSKGRGYHTHDLPIISMISLAAGYTAVVVFALYVEAIGYTGLYSNPNLLFGISCILLYWITRVVLITHRGCMHDDPIVFVMRDRTSMLCVFAIFIVLICGL